MELPQKIKRRKTRTVWVGQVGVGSNYPIRIQSMTTSDTKDTASIISEMEGLVNAGCEIVRVTVPTQADCDNLKNIRAEMKKRGIKVPLVADIHFTPSIAMQVVEYVDKVRINPGNFVDKKLFKVWEYTDEQYAQELVRIREKFLPLVLKCKEYGVAMRIGTNHGSLSDRILNRYGDTPEGMVASALEFVEICEEQGYKDIILSMKASNVQVMTAAYRLLAWEFSKTGRDYPLHLGVTEAGEGEDGRIKSAIGIGTLLEEGLGDTIRVSLTEDSIHEIPVAYQIAQKYNLQAGQYDFAQASNEKPNLVYTRRATDRILPDSPTGGTEPIRVWLSGDELDEVVPSVPDMPVEGIEFNAQHLPDIFPAGIPRALFASDPQAVLKSVERGWDKIVACVPGDLPSAFESWQEAYQVAVVHSIPWEWCLENPSSEKGISKWVELTANLPASYSLQSENAVWAYRALRTSLERVGSKACVHLRFQPVSHANPVVSAGAVLGALLLDGLGDSIQACGIGNASQTLQVVYGILQGARLRISRAEYISCPSCGRTQFNLQTTTDRIRERTSHLKGVKIAVMGCIVNGPGEMADADFGYVGTGPKKVSLYVGKECVERNIPEEEAVTRLITLIQSHGKWVDPALTA